MSVDKVILDKIEENSKELDNMVDCICLPYTQSLDDMIAGIKVISGKKDTEIAIADLNRYLLFISSSMYGLVNHINKMAIRQSVAEMIKDERYYDFYSKLTEGTIADKKSQAEIEAIANTVSVELYKRCYNRLKETYNASDNVLSSLKKICNMRTQEMQLSMKGN